ncbi:MAG: ABC transporter ATP-binding protein [Clostridia bacterium]|nr:ABC transporter ATP-binding protein [Clostridia bacterium]
MPILTVDNLCKTYLMGEVEVHALSNASLTVEEGEFVVILGPSGSGKSTLLNIIGGMDTATSGQVLVNEKNITSLNEKQLTNYRRNQIGFVFQFYNLMANLTAAENIELATEIAPDPLTPAEVLEAVGLSDRSEHFPSQLSGGEQQRVSIARAIAKNPLLLLADEPTGALDFNTGIAVLALLRKINRQTGKTVILITHNLDIARMADRVIKMKSGTIIENALNPAPIAAEEIRW